MGGLRDRLRAFAIEPNQSLASIVRMALLEWLSDRESQETDKNDISINDND
jgi:predicted DNA-binding ribbon-helix-helix protein